LRKNLVQSSSNHDQKAFEKVERHSKIEKVRTKNNKTSRSSHHIQIEVLFQKYLLSSYLLMDHMLNFTVEGNVWQQKNYYQSYKIIQHQSKQNLFVKLNFQLSEVVFLRVCALERLIIIQCTYLKLDNYTTR
jgi:hypothetical protein